MDKQSPTVEHRTTIQYPQVNHIGKEYKNMHIYV